MTVIRPSAPTEVAAIAALDHTIYGANAYPVATWIQLAEVAGPLLLVAVENDEIVGFGLVLPSSQVGEAWVMSLAVRAPVRGRGIGTALAEGLVATASARGLHDLLLTVDPDDSAAMRLWKRLEFDQEKRIDEYFGPGKDRVVMRRRGKRHYLTSAPQV